MSSRTRIGRWPNNENDDGDSNMPWEPIDPSVGVVGGDGGDASADNDVAAENTKTGGCQTNPDADLPGSSSSAGVQSAQHDSSGVAPSSAAPLVDRQSQQSATGAANLAAGKTVATVDRRQHPATSSSISDTANPLGIGEKIAPLDDSVHRQPHQRTSSEVETPRFQNEPSPSSSVTRLPEQAAERATEPAVSLPMVTKTTRRKTFGTSNTSDHMDNPLNPPEPRGAATKASATTRTSEPLTSRYERSPPSSDHSPRNNAYTHFQLPNSGSSGEEDMMDLFSPPVSSVLRIRNRGITNQVVTAASTAVVGGQHQHQGQGLVAQTPIYHQHHHQLQHSYEQAQHQYFESSVAVKPAVSAPARMPVSVTSSPQAHCFYAYSHILLFTFFAYLRYLVKSKVCQVQLDLLTPKDTIETLPSIQTFILIQTIMTIIHHCNYRLRRVQRPDLVVLGFLILLRRNRAMQKEKHSLGFNNSNCIHRHINNKLRCSLLLRVILRIKCITIITEHHRSHQAAINHSQWR